MVLVPYYSLGSLVLRIDSGASETFDHGIN